MNAVLITCYFAVCGLTYMGLQLYWLGLPSVCH